MCQVSNIFMTYLKRNDVIGDLISKLPRGTICVLTYGKDYPFFVQDNVNVRKTFHEGE